MGPHRDVQRLAHVLVQLVLLTADGTQAPDQALGDDPRQRRRDQEGGNPHVDHTGGGARRVVRVQGREHEVPGEGRADGDLRRLLVADLSHHHLVRVLPQDGAQGGLERQARLLVNVDLVDPRDGELHGVLDRDDVDVRLVDLLEH